MPHEPERPDPREAAAWTANVWRAVSASTAGRQRYRRDVGKTSTLGALYTDREAEDYFNRLGGFDGTLQASDADTIRFQYLFAATDYPDEVAVANGQSVRPIASASASAPVATAVVSTSPLPISSTIAIR